MKDLTKALAILAVAVLGSVAIMGVAMSQAHAFTENDGEIAHCKAGGGCALISRQTLMQSMRDAFSAGVATGRNACKATI